LTNFDRLGVNAEHILSPVYCGDTVFPDFLAQLRGQFSVLIVLAADNQVRECISFLSIKVFEQIIFTVKSKCLGCCRKGYNFQIGKLGDHAAMRTISVLVNTISGEFLEYVEYFTELYDEVVHMCDDSNKWFGYH